MSSTATAPEQKPQMPNHVPSKVNDTRAGLRPEYHDWQEKDGELRRTRHRLRTLDKKLPLDLAELLRKRSVARGGKNECPRGNVEIVKELEEQGSDWLTPYLEEFAHEDFGKDAMGNRRDAQAKAARSHLDTVAPMFREYFHLRDQLPDLEQAATEAREALDKAVVGAEDSKATKRLLGQLDKQLARHKASLSKLETRYQRCQATIDQRTAAFQTTVDGDDESAMDEAQIALVASRTELQTLADAIESRKANIADTEAELVEVRAQCDLSALVDNAKGVRENLTDQRTREGELVQALAAVRAEIRQSLATAKDINRKAGSAHVALGGSSRLMGIGTSQQRVEIAPTEQQIPAAQVYSFATADELKAEGAADA